LCILILYFLIIKLQLVTTLVKNCKKPITCKIRILYSIDDTIELCKLIESCGASAITVHGRFQDERPRNPNHNDYIREITKHIKIPIIAK
jgi:tRNA-dihydrouridine synthase